MARLKHRLVWRPEGQVYERYNQGSELPLPPISHEEQWVMWLESISSFSFSGQQGSLTVRKEARPRGDQYWYAYRRIGSRMVKKYLGRSVHLTIAHLEKIAATFPPPERQVTEPSHSLAKAQRRQFHEEELASTHTTTETTHAPVSPVQSGLLHDPLLSTKLHQPRPRSHLVSRTQLVKQLQQGMRHALTLVSAPAGFGKTTLLTQWLAEDTVPVAWLSLEPEDNEPGRFFSYILAALQTLSPSSGILAQKLLESSAGIALERVLTVLVNDILTSISRDFALVLDDYHVIETEAIHRGMTFLLEHLPPQMHLIIATRTDPPLPLIRLRARGQLTELRTSDLRFQLDDAHTFLQTVMRLELPTRTLIDLVQRTEGWIAGLQLVALSLQGRSDLSNFLPTFITNHRFIFDYLIEEVLSRQSVQMQSFVLATSILQRLSAPLCDAVTEQQESQTRLIELERANLFIVALDEERSWYRYHHLFAQTLHTRLQQANPSLVPQLHLRASRWYERQGLFVEAVEHALAATEFERAADLIERIDANSWAGLATAVQRMLSWLSCLPESLEQTRPLLCIIHAIAFMFTHQLSAAEARLLIAERRLDGQASSEHVFFLMGHIASTRALIARFTGDLVRSVSQAQQALDLLPHKERTPGPICCLNVAQAFLINGDVTAPQERLAQEMVTVLEGSENQSMTMLSLTTLARLQIVQGRLHDAVATFEKAAKVVSRQEELQVMVPGLTYFFGLADVLREWNKLEEAEKLLEQGLALVDGDFTTEGEVVTFGYITYARLLLALGNFAQARHVLDTFIHLAGVRSFAPHLITRGITWRTEMNVRQGNLEEATSWAEHYDLTVSDDDLGYLREREYLTLVRIHVAEGRNKPSTSFLQDISHMLDRRRQEAEVKGRRSSVLEILLLQALILAAQGERRATFAALSQALTLAEPEGYIRLFVDEGEPMRDLLRQALARAITPNYTSTLLSAFSEPIAEDSPLSPPSVLIEPLTKREREVLQALAEGASNREIAQRLIVSIGTVKKYVYNICGKLGVQSRTQALARARALHLL